MSIRPKYCEGSSLPVSCLPSIPFPVVYCGLYLYLFSRIFFRIETRGPSRIDACDKGGVTLSEIFKEVMCWTLLLCYYRLSVWKGFFCDRVNESGRKMDNSECNIGQKQPKPSLLTVSSANYCGLEQWKILDEIGLFVLKQVFK